MAVERRGADHRSGCPINLTLEVVGDKWSLLVIRDMIFGNRRHFRELLAKSEEGIASNILADRLKRLVEQGIISRADDPSHKQKAIYSLTEKGIELLPVLAQMSAWGLKHLPVTEELGIRAQAARRGRAEAVGRVRGRAARGASGRATPQQEEVGRVRRRKVAGGLRSRRGEAEEAIIHRAALDARSGPTTAEHTNNSQFETGAARGAIQNELPDFAEPRTLPKNAT